MVKDIIAITYLFCTIHFVSSAFLEEEPNLYTGTISFVIAVFVMIFYKEEE